MRLKNITAYTLSLFLLLVATFGLAACQNEQIHGIPYVFGSSGNDSHIWANQAKSDPDVDIVIHHYQTGDNYYTRIANELIGAHADTAEYLVVMRWFDSGRLAELQQLALNVWPELASHIDDDLKMLASGRILLEDGDNVDRHQDGRESSVDAYSRRMSELLHRPKDTGGFGSFRCDVHEVGFVLPVVTDVMQLAVDKYNAGGVLTSAEERLHQFYRIRLLVTQP